MLSGLFQWIVRQSAEVENQMISVERIAECTKLPQEKDQGKSAPSGWPSSGSVEFQDVSLRYTDDGPAVLKNLSFKVSSCCV
jgi:ATP-binding cassette subfamily C (CFTR/MRP) protein 4